MTKAEVIAKIETEITQAFAQANERNEKLMIQNGCSQAEIDFVRNWNETLLRPSILRAVQMLGMNLLAGPERRQ